MFDETEAGVLYAGTCTLVQYILSPDGLMLSGSYVIGRENSDQSF